MNNRFSTSSRVKCGEPKIEFNLEAINLCGIRLFQLNREYQLYSSNELLERMHMPRFIVGILTFFSILIY